MLAPVARLSAGNTLTTLGKCFRLAACPAIDAYYTIAAHYDSRKRAHRSLKHGIAGLEGVGALLPQVAVIIGAAGKIAPHAVPPLCDQVAHSRVLCGQGLKARSNRGLSGLGTASVCPLHHCPKMRKWMVSACIPPGWKLQCKGAENKGNTGAGRRHDVAH